MSPNACATSASTAKIDERRRDDGRQRARWCGGDGDQMPQARPVAAVGGKAGIQEAAFEQRQQQLRQHDADDRHEAEREVAGEHRPAQARVKTAGPRFHRRIASAYHCTACDAGTRRIARDAVGRDGSRRPVPEEGWRCR